MFVIVINSMQIDNVHVVVKKPVKFVQNSIKNLTKNVKIKIFDDNVNRAMSRKFIVNLNIYNLAINDDNYDD